MEINEGGHIVYNPTDILEYLKNNVSKGRNNPEHIMFRVDADDNTITVFNMNTWVKTTELLLWKKYFIGVDIDNIIGITIGYIAGASFPTKYNKSVTSSKDYYEMNCKIKYKNN